MRSAQKILSTLDADDLRQQLEAVEAERKSLMTLLRIARRAERHPRVQVTEEAAQPSDQASQPGADRTRSTSEGPADD